MEPIKVGQAVRVAGLIGRWIVTYRLADGMIEIAEDHWRTGTTLGARRIVPSARCIVSI
jgi:hypothetical protein